MLGMERSDWLDQHVATRTTMPACLKLTLGMRNADRLEQGVVMIYTWDLKWGCATLSAPQYGCPTTLNLSRTRQEASHTQLKSLLHGSAPPLSSGPLL